MLGAIYVGLSGMEAYSKGLQTISNNVANLDTLGYKSSTISFSDLFGQGGNGLAYTSGEGGGSIGSGVRYNKESIDFTQGTLQQTGGALDLAIQGNGFLVVQNEHGDIFYSRTGQFSADSKGFITNQNGDRLMMLDSSNQPQAIKLDTLRTNPPAATSNITFAEVLSTSVNSFDVPNITVFDSTGATHTWKANFQPAPATTPPSTTTDWTVTVKNENDVTIKTGTISFNNNGIAVAPDTLVVTTTATGAQDLSVTLDFSHVTSGSQGSTDTIKTSSIDGNALSSLTGVTVNAQGQVVLNYSDQQTKILGSVAIADSQNQQQLVRIGSGLFKNQGAGQLQYRSSGAAGIGTLQFGQVEASNVNLTAEFGNLILVQRGFDASSQVISASNDMIQQLFGMRGHG